LAAVRGGTKRDQKASADPMKKIASIFGITVPILGMIVLVLGTTAQAETFGKTDIGGSSNVLSGNYKEGSKYNLSENGSVTKGYLYTKDNSGSFNCKIVIYNVDGDTASTLVATSDEVVVVDTLGWYMFTFDPAVDLAAGEYALVWIHSDNYLYKYYDAGTAGQSESNADTYADGPSDPFGNSAKADRAYSIYCEYTPSSVDCADGVDTIGTTIKTVEEAMRGYIIQASCSGTLDSVHAYFDLNNGANNENLTFGLYRFISAFRHDGTDTCVLVDSATITNTATIDSWLKINSTFDSAIISGVDYALCYIASSDNPGLDVFQMWEEDASGHYCIHESTMGYSDHWPDTLSPYHWGPDYSSNVWLTAMMFVTGTEAADLSYIRRIKLLRGE